MQQGLTVVVKRLLGGLLVLLGALGPHIHLPGGDIRLDFTQHMKGKKRGWDGRGGQGRAGEGTDVIGADLLRGD